LPARAMPAANPVRRRGVSFWMAAIRNLITAQPARHLSPTTKAAALAYVMFDRPDLDKAERFLSDFGRRMAEREEAQQMLFASGTGAVLGASFSPDGKLAATAGVRGSAELWDAQFFQRAVELLADGVDLVVGSKRLPESLDERPRIRRTITAWFNGLLRFAFGYSGTDTHGIKALRRSVLMPILDKCCTDGEIFDTEFVLRAQRAGLTRRELPVNIRDTRPPRLSLLRRVPGTLVDLIRLKAAI